MYNVVLRDNTLCIIWYQAWRMVWGQVQAEPSQIEPPRYNKTNYNHRWRPPRRISFLLFYFIYSYIPTMTLKHKVSRKRPIKKFSRYMHTVIFMKLIPSIYRQPELTQEGLSAFSGYLVTTKSAVPVSRNRISMIVNNQLVLPIIFLKMSTGGRDEYNLSSSTCTW